LRFARICANLRGIWLRKDREYKRAKFFCVRCLQRDVYYFQIKGNNIFARMSLRKWCELYTTYRQFSTGCCRTSETSVMRITHHYANTRPYNQFLIKRTSCPQYLFLSNSIWGGLSSCTVVSYLTHTRWFTFLLGDQKEILRTNTRGHKKAEQTGRIFHGTLYIFTLKTNWAIIAIT